MPLTWFAHQVPVIGMKFARHRWFDAVALCIGSMTPDLMYSFSGYVGIDTHRWPAAFSFGVPLAVICSLLVRRVVAPVVPLVLPDLGTFRLRSYGVLAMRSPRVVTTVACAALGIGSHVTLDWFTHPGRPGERWLGYDDVEVTLFGVTEPLAGVLQVLGHSVGSLVALWMLWIIADRRLLETWYGERPVAIARRRPASTTARIEFSSIVTIGASLGFAWGRGDEFVEWVQRSAVGVGVGCVVGAAVVSSFARVDEGDVGVSR